MHTFSLTPCKIDAIFFQIILTSNERSEEALFDQFSQKNDQIMRRIEISQRLDSLEQEYRTML